MEPIRFHPQASLRRHAPGWELLLDADEDPREGPLKCVLSDFEALCVGLMEHGVDPSAALGDRIGSGEGVGERSRRLRDGLRGFRAVTSKEVGQAPLFPTPTELLGSQSRAVDRPLHRDFLPVELVWYVTTRCPRRCRYCHYVQKARSDVEDDALDLGAVERLVHQAWRSGVERFVMTGGEPLLRRDLPEIVRCVADHGLELLLFSRARYSPDRAQRYRDLGLSKIYFSIDSLRSDVNRETVENARVAEEALDSIQALAAAGVEVIVVPVVNHASVHGLAELGEAVARAGASALRPLPYKGVRNSRWNALLALTSDDEEAAREQLDRLTATIPVDLSTFRTQRALTCCESGFSTLYVMPNGGVAYCPLVNSHEGVTYGRLPEEEISELWYSRRLLELMRTNGLKLESQRVASLREDRSACVLRSSRLDVV